MTTTISITDKGKTITYHAHDPLEFGRHHNEINVGLDAWCFEPVNEAELVDNWLHAALNVTE